ncbi:hypothetical protein OG204_12185 [Streptomyces sp. NBC_01387]|uniref:nSTAND1 domain-containing NTPase n=1 Tax=Streptomyces sp. NBC_01387 TaxID=2903849 RepID=UPI003255B4EA
MSQPPELPAPADAVQQHATASGDSQIVQAGRDAYVVFTSGFVASGELPGQEARQAVPAEGELCPYPGLASFGVEQARWFFGREALIGELLGQLVEGSPLAVVGPSGAGKSSLLMAGLRPALTSGRLPVDGSREWPHAVLTPTSRPMTVLAEQLALAAGGSAEAVRQALDADPGAYVAELRRTLGAGAGSPASRRLVLIVDQLEELFTLCADKAERARFIDVISRLATPGDGCTRPDVLLVLGLRADFYGYCIAEPLLRAMLQDRQVLVGPMAESELRDAITAPAAATGLTMEPGLEELLLRDLGVFPSDLSRDRPDTGTWFSAGRLPLLAHALQMTWVQRRDRVLTVADYQATGGIHRAISRTAERRFESLDASARRGAEALFLRLVRIGDGAEDTRKRVSLGMLEASDTEASATAAALTAFTRERLLTVDGDLAAVADMTVQITHEALIKAWPRLRRWIEHGRSDVLVRQELEEAARGWDTQRSDGSLLYRGSRLESAARAAAAAPGHLSRTALDFLALSRQQAARAARVRRSVIAVLTALVLAVSGTAIFAFQQRATAQSQRDTAREQRDTAVAGQIAIEADRIRSTDPSLAAQLDLASYRMRPNDSTYTNLLAWENSPLSTVLPGAVGTPVFDRDGHRLVTRQGDGSLRLWDSRDPARPRPLSPPIHALKGTGGIALSADGRTLVAHVAGQGTAPGHDGGPALWDLSDPARPRRSGPPIGSADDWIIGLSPNGRTVVTRDQDKMTTTLRDVTDPTNPTVLTTLPGTAVALSPDGRTLAVWQDVENALQFFDISRAAAPVPLLPNGLDVVSTLRPGAVFSGDGHRLVTTGDPGGNGVVSADGQDTIRVWDVTEPRHPRLRNEGVVARGSALALALRPDGQVVATAGQDRTIQLWRTDDTEGGEPAPPSSSDPERAGALVEMNAPLGGHTDALADLVFSPDGSALASSDGSTVRLWSLPRAASTPGGTADRLAITQKGKTLVTGTEDSTGVHPRLVRLWDLTAPRGPKPLGGSLVGNIGKFTVPAAVSPDGRILGTLDKDSAIRLWNIADPAHPVPYGVPFAGTGSGDSLDFAPDGRTLWRVDPVGRIHVWNVADPAHPRAVDFSGPEGLTNVRAFSPDSRILVSSDTSDTSTARLWDISDPAEPKELSHVGADTSHDNPAAFSADGRILATPGSDRTVRLWDVSDPRHPAAVGGPLAGHTDTVTAIGFVPHTRLLATAARDNTVRLWDLSDLRHPKAKGRAVSAPGAGPLGFSPDGRTLATGGVSGTVQVWDLDVEHAAARICSATSHVLSAEVWERHFLGIQYRPACR